MKEQTPPQRHHLDRRAAAIQIGRCRNYGPPSIAVTPKMVRYRRRSVLAWIEERAALAAMSAVVIVVFFAVSVLTALAG